MFTKSVPKSMKLTVKGGAAVDPDTGTVVCSPCTIQHLKIEHLEAGKVVREIDDGGLSDHYA